VTIVHAPRPDLAVDWAEPQAVRRGRIEVAAVPASVRETRHWTAQWLAGANPPLDQDSADATVLLVSELVTNAVQAVEAAQLAQDRQELAPGMQRVALLAGPAMISLVLTERLDCLRIEVHDFACAPVPRSAGSAPRAADQELLEDETGRGLCVVDALAARWGWQPSPFGKVVWCEIEACS
jgi:hypothetical protein